MNVASRIAQHVFWIAPVLAFWIAPVLALTAVFAARAQERPAGAGGPLAGLTPREFSEFRLGLDEFREMPLKQRCRLLVIVSARALQE